MLYIIIGVAVVAVLLGIAADGRRAKIDLALHADLGWWRHGLGVGIDVTGSERSGPRPGGHRRRRAPPGSPH